MRNDIGWVKVHRKMLDWGWVRDANIFKFYVLLILLANFTDGEFLGVKIPRGSIATSIRSLSKNMQMSDKTVQRCISELVGTGEISVRYINKKGFSIITIKKYELYQGGVVNDTTPSTTPSTTPHTTLPTTNIRSKELNNDKNVKNPSPVAEAGDNKKEVISDEDNYDPFDFHQLITFE